MDLNQQKALQLDIGNQISGEEEVIEVVLCGALALQAVSKAAIAKQYLYNAGVVPLAAWLFKILATPDVLTPVVNMLQECSSEVGKRPLCNNKLYRFI